MKQTGYTETPQNLDAVFAGPIPAQRGTIVMLGTAYAPFYDTLQARAAGASPTRR